MTPPWTETPRADPAIRSRPVLLWRLITALSALVASLALIAAGVAYFRTGEIKESQVEGCQQIGEPLQEIIIAGIRDDIASSASIPRSFFPDIPAEAYRDLVRERTAAREQRIEVIESLPPCEERFG